MSEFLLYYEKWINVEKNATEIVYILNVFYTKFYSNKFSIKNFDNSTGVYNSS